MGLERNADVVKMVSYAPLLANVSGRTDWHGMIYFDSTHVFGTVSYYLWKLFGENRPDYSVQTDVALQCGQNIRPSPARSAWAPGTPRRNSRTFALSRTEKHFTPLTFPQSTHGWQEDGGNWSVVDGAYSRAMTP